MDWSKLFVLLTISVLAAAPRPAHAFDQLQWSLYGRYSQGLVLYRGNERDTGFASSASATVDFVGTELKWREPPVGGSRKWRFSGSTEFEVFRQVVLGVPHGMLRGSARVSYGRVTQYDAMFEVAPILEFHGGQYSLFRVTGSKTASQETVLREGVGLGGSLIYRYRDVRHMRYGKEYMEFKFWGLTRYESPAHSSVLPNPILPGKSYEFGISGTYELWKKYNLQFRYRSFYETYEWKPAIGGDNSSMTNVFNIFDFSFGYRW